MKHGGDGEMDDRMRSGGTVVKKEGTSIFGLSHHRDTQYKKSTWKTHTIVKRRRIGVWPTHHTAPGA